jgi:hypothetical protein
MLFADRMDSLRTLWSACASISEGLQGTCTALAAYRTVEIGETPMTVKQLAPPTLNEVANELREFEKKYAMTTVDFLEKDGLLPNVEGDDAVEWLYRVEQFRALRRVEGSPSSTRIERATSLNSRADVNEVMDRLAA